MSDYPKLCAEASAVYRGAAAVMSASHDMRLLGAAFEVIAKDYETLGGYIATLETKLAAHEGQDELRKAR